MADTASPQATTPLLGRLITTRRAAEMCGVHPNTIREYIREGRLPAYRVGERLIRIDANDVAALIVPAR